MRESEASLCLNLTNRRLQDKNNICLKKRRSSIHTSLSKANRIRPRCCIQTSLGIQDKKTAITIDQVLPTKGLGQEQGQLQEQVDHQQDVEAKDPTTDKKKVNISKSITILESRAKKEWKTISTSLSALLSPKGMNRSNTASLTKRQSLDNKP